MYIALCCYGYFVSQYFFILINLLQVFEVVTLAIVCRAGE